MAFTWPIVAILKFKKTLKVVEILFSLSAIIKMGQFFERTGNIARRKVYRMSINVTMQGELLTKTYSSQRQEKCLQNLSVEFPTSENKTLSRRTITRR